MGSKRKHNVLNIETKVKIIKKLDEGESGSSLAQFYNVGKSTIADIKRKKEIILSYASKMVSVYGKITRKVMKSATNDKLDKALFLWFLQKKTLGEPISGPTLRKQALIFNSKMGDTSDFKASSGWLRNFKSRHGIRELNIEGEILTCNSTSAKKFKETFLNTIKREGYTRNDANHLEFEILNDDDIIKCVKESELLFKITNEYGNMKNYTGPTPSEAFTALESATQWYEQQPECNSTELLLLKRIKDLAAKKCSLKVEKEN